MPRKVTGEKNRLYYLTKKLINNAFLRMQLVNGVNLVRVKFDFCRGILSEEDLEEKTFLKV